MVRDFLSNVLKPRVVSQFENQDRLDSLNYFNELCQSLNMVKKHPKRPRDTNQLAKAIVDLAIGESTDSDPDEGKNPHAVALGRKGGQKGGAARAKKLTSEQRAEIARKAAKARWAK